MTWEEINEQEKSKETEPKQCETELKIGCEGCPFGIIVCTNPKYNEQESKSEEPKPEECEEGIEIGCNGCPWYQCTNPKYKEQ